MNELFYSLSAAVMLFACWFILGLPIVTCLSIWIILTAVLIKSVVQKQTTTRAGTHITRLYKNKQTSSPMIFAPIHNEVSAMLASQLTSTMTLSEIEARVSARSNQDGIHTRMNIIQR